MGAFETDAVLLSLMVEAAGATVVLRGRKRGTEGASVVGVADQRVLKGKEDEKQPRDENGVFVGPRHRGVHGH